MSEPDAGEKTHEPSQQKLDEARKKGEVPRSTDFTTSAGYAGLVFVVVAFGTQSLQETGAILAGIWQHAGYIDQGTAELTPAAAQLAVTLLPWSIIPFGFCALSLVCQRAFVFTGSKLQPKVSRISVLSNAKQKFGRNGLFEFAKSAAKLTIYSLALFVYIWRSLPEIVGLVTLDPGVATASALALTVRFLWLVFSVAFAIGIIDLGWQQAEHIRKNRMTRKEITDEHKNSEGDPHMKGQRRQRGMEIASSHMLADVPDASVILVNPTHYAVALKWSRVSPGAPVCVAKGVDSIAQRIREIATEAGVPIHSDPPTTRALYSTVKIGEEITPEQFAPVAVAIRFAEDMRRKARAE